MIKKANHNNGRERALMIKLAFLGLFDHLVTIFSFGCFSSNLYGDSLFNHFEKVVGSPKFKEALVYVSIIILFYHD